MVSTLVGEADGRLGDGNSGDTSDATSSHAELLDGPNGSDTWRMTLAVVSNDTSLVDRCATFAAAAGVPLVAVGDPETSTQVLRLRSYRVLVVDGASRHLVSANLPDLSPFVGLTRSDDLFMLIRPGAHAGPAARLAVYPRAATAELLEDLELFLPRPSAPGDPADEILGNDAAIRLVREQIRKVSRFSDISVLIVGETGTGKELVAEAIHALTYGTDSNMVPINCAAIPETLFESELFGHEAGAYTGARGARAGLLEEAAGRVLFLDEVGEMPEPLQAKLLRALETRLFRRVGANRDLPLRARIVSATNRHVTTARTAGLRPDLYYRLAGFTIVLPPLRKRTADIPLLARKFLGSFRERHGIGPKEFAADAIEVLMSHPWPGNVRELRAAVEQAAIVTRHPVIDAHTVHLVLGGRPNMRPSSLPPHGGIAIGSLPKGALGGRSMRPADGESLSDMQKRLILEAYEKSGRNVSRAARGLGMPRSTFRARLRRYGVKA